MNLLIEKSDGYTGAEIEAAIESAMYEAFSDNKREITTADILLALSSSVPIAKLMEKDIISLRNWAKNRARNASILPIQSNIRISEEEL